MRKVAFLLGKMSFILTFLFLNSISGNAQITETSLRGTVTDSTGNVIVASAIVAQNEATAQVSTATTNENGEFVFPSLPSGSYTIFVRVPGFKTFEQKRLKLNVGQTSDLTIKLEIGEVSATIEVEDNENLTQVSIEVVLQTGAFAFMNRFTDGLRLPSEDAAVKNYQETYGDGSY